MIVLLLAAYQEVCLTTNATEHRLSVINNLGAEAKVLLVAAIVIAIEVKGTNDIVGNMCHEGSHGYYHCKDLKILKSGVQDGLVVILVLGFCEMYAAITFLDDGYSATLSGCSPS